MKLDQLRKRIAKEPERQVEHAVHDGGEPTGKTRTATYRHILGAPASAEVVRDWQERWPSYPLPDDLRALVGQANGIHLWADVEHGRAYTGLAPIEEWKPARSAMYGDDAGPEALADRYLAAEPRPLAQGPTSWAAASSRSTRATRA